MNLSLKNKISFIQQIREHLSSSLLSDYLEQILERYISFLNKSYQSIFLHEGGSSPCCVRKGAFKRTPHNPTHQKQSFR